MLELIDIKKDYKVAGGAVHALNGVSIKFRRNEFVSILGASGCGKTTLLNIVGGLDKYTSGDLVIEGKSTKQFKDGDWDTYRNHSVGFIFQSYHLIPHQTILQNVELALTISGVTREERRRRAVEALEKVGLSDKLKNKPNQLSGGQAQRVAIARALINDPEIVLADEPTGALDSKTSVQIMELLKEIAKDRLVIMVTHNPELAEQYSTRIIRLLDGEVTDDSMPFDGVEAPAQESAEEQSIPTADAAAAVKNKGRKKKSSMSFGMAFGLSLKNLLSKGKRTAMVSVAGSIGIIGVSMVLAISAGVQGYIADMENDMLSGNPVAITQSAYDFSSLMSISVSNTNLDLNRLKKGDKVYVRSLLDTLGTFAQGFERTNNIDEAYVDYILKMPEESVNVVQFDYAFNVVNNIYTTFNVSKDEETLKNHFQSQDEYGEHPTNSWEMSVAAIRSMYSSVLSHVEEYKQWGSMISTVETFREVPNNFDYVMSQYDVLAVDYNGNAVTSDYSEEYLEELFNDKGTLIMVVEDHYFNDLMFAQYGFFNEDEFLDYAFTGVGGEAKDELVGKNGIPYAEIIGNGTDKFKFTYYPNDCVYSKQTFKVKYLSDTEVRILISMIFGESPELALIITNDILTSRDKGDDELKKCLEKYNMGMLFDTLRKPANDEQEGFVANAYSSEYTVHEDGMDDMVLPAFSSNAEAYNKRVDMGVKLILQKKREVSYGCLETGLYYTNALTDYILDTEENSKIVKYIKETEKESLDRVPCYVDYYYVDETKDSKFYVFATEQGSIDTGASMMETIIGNVSGGASTKVTAGMVGGSRLPTAIYMYPVDFDKKDIVTGYLDAWNKMCEAKESYTYTDFEGKEQTVKLEVKDKITYTDTVGLIIAMINTMIEMITFALVAFTALSLVVSTVMIGIITYVSVVERVKEIGILRAVGARKKDIKRLFNAETFIIGFSAGAVGIGVTYLLSGILNLIIGALSGIYTIAALPIWQAFIMIGISIVLTLISGLIPASAAAQKDPVVALRTE